MTLSGATLGAQNEPIVRHARVARGPALPQL